MCTLFLEELHLQKLCLDGLPQQKENDDIDDKDDDDSIFCQAYIVVENKGKEDILYQLNIWNPDAYIEMKDGQQYQFNLEYLSKQTLLYYKIIATHLLIIFYQNQFQLDIQQFKLIHQLIKIKFRISITIQMYNYIQVHIMVLLNMKLKQLMYQIKQLLCLRKRNIGIKCLIKLYKTQHSKSIYKSAFEFCGQNCLLKISLEAQQQVYNFSKIGRNLDFDDLVYVTVTQEFMDIQNGIPIQIQVNKDSPRQFIYSQLNEISGESKMKIVLHEIYGKGTICLSFNDEDKQDLEMCEFQVIGNVLELTQSQIKQKLDEFKLKQNPYIIIKVYSLVSTSKLQLSIEIFNDKNNHKLILGVPTRIQMNAQDEQIYQYFNIQSNDDLYFKFIKMQGSTSIQVSQCLDNASKACEQEIIINEQLLTGQSYSQHIIHKSDEKRYCELCIVTLKLNFHLFIV